MSSPAAAAATGQPLHADLPGGGQALFSDRSDGNMSSVGGPGHEQGAKARDALLRRTGAQRLARGYQVHGSRVRAHASMPPAERPGERPADADGQASSVTGLAVMVLAADCMPVVLGCEGAVAAVHAGWRGLAAGVLEEGVAALLRLGGQAPIGAAIGPCAGACCYEVGPEVHAALSTGIAGHANIDLRALAAERLRRTGVQDVQMLGGCTICEARWFSHRREGQAAGRMAAIAWLS